MLKAYPSLNIGMKDLRGEVWKEMPGFEDEYLVSSFGRIKSQDRWVDMGTYDCFRPGRIRRLHVQKHPGKHGKKGEISVQICLHKGGKRYLYSVARLVYCVFVRRFKLNDHTLIISARDKNILNLHYSNLELRSLSEVAKEGFANQTRSTKFQLQIRPVTQYTLEGKRIKTYKSAKQAGEATGISAHYINDAARTKTRVAGGSYWRYSEGNATIRVKGFSKTGNPAVAPLVIAGMDNKERHYHFNRSNKNIPGERWKAVPGYEDTYTVSDHGRVRSLSRPKKIRRATDKVHYSMTKEFIRSQQLQIAHNAYLNEKVFYPTIALKNDAGYKTFTVARLVYQLFGETNGGPLSENIQILHKDGDNLHNHISNLQPATFKERAQNAFQRNRAMSHFASLSKKERKQITALAMKANFVAVNQYNLSGKLVKSFSSIVDAAKSTGVGKSSISNAISGRYQTAGGFIWRKHARN
jgi:hypothetical protein